MPNDKIFHFLGMKMCHVIPSIFSVVADCEMNQGQGLWPTVPPFSYVVLFNKGKRQENVHFPFWLRTFGESMLKLSAVP
ncbi:hypothetical protein RJT34_25458 [Clitoria ternatea]|uniref:Uncharacterized protein n=1 Tax=Clitoria ternatea TaxID=43366 RepID=A0AAN9FPX4_CLITE